MLGLPLLEPNLDSDNHFYERRTAHMLCKGNFRPAFLIMVVKFFNRGSVILLTLYSFKAFSSSGR